MPGSILGTEVRRVEDEELLLGKGTFVDNLQSQGVAHAVFVRSPFAHARITGIDTARGGERPTGCSAVFTADDLGREELAELRERERAGAAGGAGRGQGAVRRRPGRPGGRRDARAGDGRRRARRRRLRRPARRDRHGRGAGRRRAAAVRGDRLQHRHVPGRQGHRATSSTTPTTWPGYGWSTSGSPPPRSRATRSWSGRPTRASRPGCRPSTPTWPRTSWPRRSASTRSTCASWRPTSAAPSAARPAPAPTTRRSRSRLAGSGGR